VVCGRGQLPDDLPPSGPRRFRALRPFDPADCRGTVRLMSHASRWPEARVRVALEPFLAGRPDWPTQEEFDAAGRATPAPGAQQLRRPGAPGRRARPRPARHRRRRNTAGATSGSTRSCDASPAQATAGPPSGPSRRPACSASTTHHEARDGPLWAKRLGLVVPDGAATAPIRWSDEAIDRLSENCCRVARAGRPGQSLLAPVVGPCTRRSRGPLAGTTAGRAATGCPAPPADAPRRRGRRTPGGALARRASRRLASRAIAVRRRRSRPAVVAGLILHRASDTLGGARRDRRFHGEAGVCQSRLRLPAFVHSGTDQRTELPRRRVLGRLFSSGSPIPPGASR
jgi:hypothetical protein